MTPKLKIFVAIVVAVLAALVIWRIVRRRQAAPKMARNGQRAATQNGLAAPVVPAASGSTLDLAQSLAN